MDLNNIYKKIEENNIKVFPFGVNDIKAVTIEADGKYGVFVNKQEISDSDEEFCVLAHEYGHCISGSTHKPSSNLDIISRHEYRANRRAILEFLPVEKIKIAIQSGCQTLYEISKFVDMPEEFVFKAIQHYTCIGAI